MIRTEDLRPVFAICFLLATSSLAQSPPDKQQQIETHSRQASEFLKNNRTELAAREFSAILALDPNNVDARGNLGVLLYFRGDYVQATPHLRAALKLQPTLAKIQALLGMCERRTGDTARAEGDLKESLPRLREEKLKVETGMELIELYYGAGEFEKAAGVVGMLRQLKPADPEILYTAYRIYSTLTDEAMLGVATAAPGSAYLHQLMARELTRQGNNEGAIAHYREALKIDPRLPGAHFELAEMLSAAADPDGAQKEYQAALVVDPADEKSECRLGEFALRGNDLNAATAHFSRALELQPGDADAAAGMAKTLIGMNQPEKAELLLERAAKLEPFDAPIHYHLAMVYRRLGRTADSRRELAEFQKVKDMKEKLKQTYHEMRLQPKPERTDPTVPE
ncbi:MAG: tetratricopeptide repeat protein [Bryobacteraceae bacterium]